MIELRLLGFGPDFEKQLSSPTEIPARITAEHRGGYAVVSALGDGRAKLRGRLRQAIGGAPGVGDWVIVGAHPSREHAVTIERVLDRRTLFSRGASGREARSQIIAANVDVVFIVTGLDHDFNIRRIERYLARVWASGAKPAILLNKADLVEDPDSMKAEIERHALGVPVHLTRATQGKGLDPVRAMIHEGTTVAFVGSSGAGKSSLVNALLGKDRMRTHQVRASDERGMHTTTHRELIVLEGGGLLVDTPGMRELGLEDDEGLGAVFRDIEALGEACRFRDCQHQGEPGCAIAHALDSGELDPERYAHFRKLEREAASFERRHTVHKRREAERAFGKIVKGIMREKKRSRGDR